MLLILLFFAIHGVNAAIIEPKIELKEVKKNDFITIPIYLDTQFEEVNAVEVYVNFSENLVFRDYLDGKSVITHWLEKPKLQYLDLRRPNIVFSGIVAGGISGRNLNLVELIFEAKESGRAKIEIDKKSKVLLNDGKGTQIKLLALSESFNIKDTNGYELKKRMATKIPEDIYPPDPFKIYFVNNPEIFDGKYYITFETKDKQSGIAYYEIAEKPINIFFMAKPDFKDLEFKKADSPYVLEDQSLKSYILVKAVDKAGNERIEYLPPQKILSIDDFISLLFFVILLVLILKLRIYAWFIKRK
ncbi:MAG: hypothetical protein ACP5JU_01750 [Minisyncoccia bacterium]